MNSTMKTNSRTKWILLAAIAAVPVAGVTAPAGAQYQREDRGDALDANRRIGDDRRNTSGRNYRSDTRIDANRQPTGNQIVTGNVTGNRQFRGDPGYSSPREFRGNTASDVSDNFIRSSAGTAGASDPDPNYNASVPFYPQGRTVQPPPGFVQQDFSAGGYVPAATVDDRIDRGAVTPRGGSLILDGPMQPQDRRGANSIITASPLLGVQQLPYSQQPGLYGQPLAGQRAGMLDDDAIQQMRDELRAGAVSPEIRTGDTPDGEPRSESRRPDVGGTDRSESADGQAQRLDQETVGTRIRNLTNDAEGDARQQSQQQAGPINAQPLSANAGNITGQRTRRRQLATPGEQTPAYAELQRKLREYSDDPNLTDEQAFRAAQRARRQAEAARKNADPAVPTTPAAPGGTTPAQPEDADADVAPQSDAERLGLTDFSKRNEGVLKGDPSNAQQQRGAQPPTGDASALRAGVAPASPEQSQPPAPAARGPKPAPVKIDSLAAGVPGKGLAELLTGAESLMAEGRFSSALQKYDQAEQVAPNNPLIKLGRANAELGASYFARAEQHLREAFSSDEALLMGQYDLRGFFGEDRLKIIANDLKQIANTEQEQVTPVFLLAYVAYNSGNERMAAGYLDLADKRAGGKDPLINKIREYWTLPATEEAAPAQEPVAEPNK